MINVQRDMAFDLNLIHNSGFSTCSDKHFVNGNCHTVVEKTHNRKSNKIILEMKDVSYKYDSANHFTVNSLNLQVFDKEILLITGNIGSGKTTLIKLMTRLIYPNKGQILLNDKCIYNIPIKTYFRRVGFMPQNSILFKRSIIENIKYNNNVKDDDIIHVMKKYSLEGHFPEGLHVSSTTLSGGQRQLIWFLRIFFMKPDIIVMDEPTASLDEETKFVFIRIMKTLLSDKTIIIITHDQFLYQYGTRIVTMKQLQ
jgi:ABC-type bacteriocin/lantibiotic exporter with double-glycine peptidase domain